MSSHSTGYYGSALSLNLDVPEGARLFVWDGPSDYVDWISPLPPRARIIRGLDSDTDAAGFIETKVCSIDEMWWAMKFVSRNHHR